MGRIGRMVAISGFGFTGIGHGQGVMMHAKIPFDTEYTYFPFFFMTTFSEPNINT